MAKSKKTHEVGQANGVTHKKLVPDAIDYHLVNILQEDSSLSGREISSKLEDLGHKLGDAAINVRIGNLIDEGIIEKRTVLLNYDYFGAGQVCFLTAKLSNSSQEKLDLFIESARDDPDVYELYEIAGQIDYLIKLRVKSLPEAGIVSKRLSTTTGADVTTLGVLNVFKDEIAIHVPRAPRNK